MAIEIIDLGKVTDGDVTVDLTVTVPDFPDMALFVSPTRYHSNFGTVVPSTVTWNGTALTKIEDITSNLADAARWGVSLWYLKAPEPGEYTVAITYATTGGGGTSDGGAKACVALNVDLGTTIGTAAEASGTSTSATVTATAASGEVVIDTVFADDTGLTVGADQTAIGTASGTDRNNEMSWQAGATSVVMSWTIPASNKWFIIAVPLKPAILSYAKRIAYEMNVYDNPLVLRTSMGVPAIPYEIGADFWFLIGGITYPTSREYTTPVDDPVMCYAEDTEYMDDQGTTTIKTSRGQLLQVIAARMSGKGVM